MVVKNYQELCKLLGIEPKSGNTKIAHMNNFKNYFTFKKEGNKIVIGKIYETPKFTGVAKNSLLSKECDCILLMLLMKNNKNYIHIPMNALANLLGFCNENYQLVQKSDTPIYQALKEKHDKEFYQGKKEFLKLSRQSFTTTIQKALDRLKKKNIIDYVVTHYGCSYKDKEVQKELANEIKNNPNFNFKTFCSKHSKDGITHFPLSPEVDNIRGQLLLETLSEYDCDSLHEVIKNYKSEDFFESYNKKLFENLNIIRSYRVYSIKSYDKNLYFGTETLKMRTESLNEKFYTRLTNSRNRKQSQYFEILSTDKIFRELLEVTIKIKQSDLKKYEDKISKILNLYSKPNSTYPQLVGIEPFIAHDGEVEYEFYDDYII